MEQILQTLQSNPVLQSEIGAALGNTTLQVGNCHGPLALCFYEKRIIQLDPSLFEKSPEDQLAYVVFELFNASKNQLFKNVVSDSLTVDCLVEKIERLEHDSALQTKRVLLKVYGKHCKFELQNTPEDFRHFYALEQLKGHAQWIGKKYMPELDYQGSLPHPVEMIDSLGRNILLGLLFHNNKEDQESRRQFTEIYRNLRMRAIFDQSFQITLDCANDLFDA